MNRIVSIKNSKIVCIDKKKRSVVYNFFHINFLKNYLRNYLHLHCILKTNKLNTTITQPKVLEINSHKKYIKFEYIEGENSLISFALFKKLFIPVDIKKHTFLTISYYPFKVDILNTNVKFYAKIWKSYYLIFQQKIESGFEIIKGHKDLNSSNIINSKWKFYIIDLDSYWYGIRNLEYLNYLFLTTLVNKQNLDQYLSELKYYEQDNYINKLVLILHLNKIIKLNLNNKQIYNYYPTYIIKLISSKNEKIINEIIKIYKFITNLK